MSGSLFWGSLAHAGGAGEKPREGARREAEPAHRHNHSDPIAMSDPTQAESAVAESVAAHIGAAPPEGEEFVYSSDLDATQRKQRDESYYSWPCRVCGAPIPRRHGRGRPREAHDECRQFDKVSTWFEQELERIVPMLDPEQREAMRSHLWSLANRMNADAPYMGDAAKAETLGIPQDDLRLTRPRPRK